MAKSIYSKRSLLHSILLPAGITFLSCFFALQLIITGAETLPTNSNDGVGLIALGIPLLVLAIYFAMRFIMYIPAIGISNTGITISYLFKKTTINWSEVKHIELTGKQTVSALLIPYYVEGTVITLKDNSTIVLPANNYRNMPHLRVILQRADKLLQSRNSNMHALDFEMRNSQPVDTSALNKNPVEFNGNHLFTIEGIVFYCFALLLLFIIILIILPGNTQKNIVGGALALIGFTIPALAVSRNFNYFIITDGYLVIKNTIWFWRKHAYAFDNIHEVVIERPSKGVLSLRVITTNFNSYFYPASSLNKKTWQLFYKALKDKSISIRNEAL